MIIDIHTHAFPDALADRTIPFLEEESGLKACLDGRISSLVGSMDTSGIDVAVVASIATNPAQFDSIMVWSASISSPRIVPFPSIHPADPDALDRVGEIKKAGFRGIKMHPFYQDFILDSSEVFPIYDRIQEEGLVLLMHTGFDVAFERKRIADPLRLQTVVRNFPEIKIIASHFGAWEDWDEVERRLLGERVYIDTSYSIPALGEERARKFLLRHPGEYILFGTDSPWGDQRNDLDTLRRFRLGSRRTERLLGLNAAVLLGLE